MSLNYNKLIQEWQKLGLEGLKEELMSVGSQEAQKILEILNQSSKILEKYPEQLPSQLVASFRDPQDNFIIDLALEIAKADNMTWLMPIAPFPPTEEACVGTLHRHDDFVGSIVCINNDQFISSSEDGTMRVWDINSKSTVKILAEHKGPINWMHYSLGKKHLLSASDDYTVKIWNISDWSVWRTLKGHTDYVSKVSETNTDLIISISKDQTVKVWNFNSGDCLHTLKGHNSWVYCLAVAPDGSRAITASVNSTMIVWDLVTGKNLQTIIDGGGDVTYIYGLILGGSNYSEKGHKEYPLYAQWLEDGRIISASKDIIIWRDDNYTIL
ncbi:MAG: WD40 repeat domain-containing protein, partial [Promethearchaeota archaeon]